ncbi:PrsW family intramembrane metalloprotease [Halosimplex sp. TS25]|uniref:PrsW family intramembrane metalloprotease n=1 Tax=Halosimplex rarum TaxID=3396619 RepID=UPI0039EB7E63
MSGGRPPSGGESGTDGPRPSVVQRLGRWVRTRAENVGRIARWEVTKNAGGVDRRTIAIALLAVLGLGAMAPMAVSQGVALDQGIYRVGVVEEDPYYDPVYLDPTFRVQDPSSAAVQAGYQEIRIVGPQVREYANSTKGRAAVDELRSSTMRYNDGIMDLEDNQSAAFPVTVNLTYVDREASRVIAPGQQAITIGSEEGGDDGDGTDGPDDGQDGQDDGPAADGGDDGSSDDGDGTNDGDTGGDGSADVTRPSEGSNVAGSSISARLTGGSTSGAPSDITPPFPFRSLVLAFVFVLPLNFVIQAYGSTVLSERINRRGELLLVAPVSRGDIIVGKTLPYFAAALSVATVITLLLQGSAVSVLAMVPLALLFLAATFLGAMFARSFKELTFVTVTITVTLTSYAFVPAIFTDVTPIALISPLTLVVRDLQGQAIGLGQFAFSTLPPTLTALVCFGLGAGLYREEDMFTQRPIPYKVLDALAGPIKRRRSVALVTAVLLPFVLVGELVLVAFLYPLSQGVSLEVVLVVAFVGIAVIEELAKSLHVYAGYAHARFDGRLRSALVVGAFSGLGFFVAEKFTLIVRLADLQSLPIGQAQMGSQAALSAGLPLPVVLGALLLAPLALHVVTASISAVGARGGRRSYAVALVIAVGVHVAYNLTVVSALVG